MIREHQYRNDSLNNTCTYRYYETPCGRPRDDHEEVDYVTKQRNQTRARNRKAFAVYVDLDPSPGDFHTLESAQEILLTVLKNRIGPYNPEVALAPDEIQPENRPGRGAFIVRIDLDPLPGGQMHTTGSAIGVIHNTLQLQIPHYNPNTLMAPDNLIPSKEISKP